MQKFISVIIVALTSIGIIAQDDCTGLITEALTVTTDSCTDIGRNQACYGHTMIDATVRDDVTFTSEGDIINLANLESLRLSSYDASADTWGVSLMQVQANIPDSVSGQGVRLLIFGDTQIENAVPFYTPLTVTANSNTRLRSSPSSANDFNIVTGVPSGSQLNAVGRDESGEWLRVNSELGEGWIGAIVVDGDVERMTLPVIEIGEPAYGPLQAFYLTTGINNSDCAELSDNGLLVQTPKGAGNIEFLVNEVSIRMGGNRFPASVGEQSAGESG